MESNELIPLIGAVTTISAAILTAVVHFFRERSEREKWKRTLELEERRIVHEENRWALELNHHRELELFKMRLKTYPEIFAALEQISHYHQDEITDEIVRALADKLNNWGYSDAGLCMLADTRKALFSMRKNLVKFLRNEMDKEEIMHGARQDLIELMRRDLNHSWSLYREFDPLTAEDSERIRKILKNEKKPVIKKYNYSE